MKKTKKLCRITIKHSIISIQNIWENILTFSMRILKFMNVAFNIEIEKAKENS